MTPSTELLNDVERTAKEVRSPKVRAMARSIAIDPTLNEGVLAMMERKAEMYHPLTALLAGIAAVPAARRIWEESLDELWERNRIGTQLLPEVVIGSGLHSAIYCAMRVVLGKQPPVVLEAEPRIGGIFAASRSATFFLNSRNRPGGLSIPRNQGALNFLPGSMVQPSDLGAAEYQVNSDLAFVIRSVFALTGVKVVPNVRVQALASESRFVRRKAQYRSQRQFSVRIELQDGRRLRASRVIVANGIGVPQRRWAAGERLLNFRQFLSLLDKPFPLRGMRRVAVIGAGDSGKCAIEALTGQGPSSHMSVASLDWPDEITWFGQESRDRKTFEECNRPRYKRIGTLLEANPNRSQRVKARSSRVDYVDRGYDCVLVNGEPFDVAIDCTGFIPEELDYRGNRVSDMSIVGDMARVAPLGTGDFVDRMYYIGPAARLPRTAQERMAVPEPPLEEQQREAEVAAYRYAGRTAMLAERLS